VLLHQRTTWHAARDLTRGTLRISRGQTCINVPRATADARCRSFQYRIPVLFA
jgi:hypothetical protein